jgi:hypothetical protein
MKVAHTAKDWVVVGAGPAGLTYLAKLLSLRVAPESILWVDEAFDGGAFAKYKDVPGNTKVKSFISWALSNSYLQDLSKHPSKPLAHLESLDQEKSCTLGEVHDVIKNYTSQLLSRVPHYYGPVSELEYNNVGQFWKVFLNDKTKAPLQTSSSASQSDMLVTRNVCLAIGGEPLRHTNLHIGHQNKKMIDLYTALSLSGLQANVSPGDTIAIVGGSHSAFVIMYLLHKLNIPNVKIVNFYRDPLRFAVYMQDFILYDNTGLKGEVAQWTKSILEGNSAPNFSLERIHIDDEAKMTDAIQRAGKFIYTHGFGRSRMPRIIYDLPDVRLCSEIPKPRPNIAGYLSYSNINGAIEVPSQSKGTITIEGLYGFGLAFPEKVITPVGELEMNIGLGKFGVLAHNWLKHTKL